ncbi:hypothetical protein O3P69_008924 [Scylla paramamosain]|uniref:Uncharacterized protein n=1 Tax=Scylla paramamosain TaxID=85552 RepID=A0AAW0TP69_SCYPA
MSSEESMIAAQLLSMANDNPAVTTSSSYVYSVPTTVYDASGTRLTEGTYITIPSTTQAGTLILVNHSGSGTGLVTVASGVQNQQQPPPAASPALSSTSSHSSIASSPSSTSSKTKKPPPKSKTVPPATPPVVAKPKTPPPPKAPAPKPTVAKTQLEESDETKARIQAILEQYKQDLANTPQPQPAPRNRKNCPPPKNEGKTSTKKKSPVKKVEGGAGNSPAVSEGSIVGCPSPSPSPGPANDNSVGPSGSATGGQPVQFSQVVASQGSTTPGNHSVPDEKIKAEGSPEVVASAPQILQGVMVGTGEAGIATSPMSSSSHEGSPANTQSRIRLATRPQDMRSNSIDSLKSDLSVEEVQIPPSPATLTKQIQSAYMTEAALSPSVSQSQHSGSSYSSPSTTHDLPFTEAPATSDDSSGGGLTQPGHSSAPSAPGLSVTGVSPEGDTQMGALTSPSGDVYLHQSGTGLGLESLEAGTLPLVSGMEVRTHSPALSDLVSSGPLLTWSPRSADSMMAQSPSLNDALTANIPLDVNHSEDSLCDSSTGFPGLFSIEGDGVSVSSSTSEDTGNTTAGVSNNQQHTLQQDLESQEQIEVTIDLHPRESEQDHTITSTRSPTQLELPVATLRGITTHSIPSSGSIVINHGSQETPWRFDNTIVSQAKSVINQTSEPTNGHHNDKQSADPEETAGPSNNIQVNRTRTKPLKSEANIKQEHGSGLLGIDIKDEKLIKLEKVIKEHSDGGIGRTRGAKKRTETDSVGEIKEEESQGEQKISGEIKQSEDSTDMKFGEGECGEEMRRGGRGARAARRGDGYVLMEEEVQNHLDEDSAVPRGNRGRHVSGTSDTSSNYSVECAVTPAVLDTPSISGGRRRRRHSRESSASSRDGSPLTIHSHEFPPSGVNTRRSSSRDHAKKKKCSCCVGGEQKKSTSGSGRRVSTRAARGSSSGSLQ